MRVGKIPSFKNLCWSFFDLNIDFKKGSHRQKFDGIILFSNVVCRSGKLNGLGAGSKQIRVRGMVVVA